MAYCSIDGEIRNALKEKNILFFPVTVLNKKELKRVIKSFVPDIIHAHDMRAGFVAAQACGSIPLISHIHNNAFNSRKLTIKSIAYLFAAIKAKHIFWVSKSSFSGYFFHQLFRKKSTVLYNVIDIDALYKKMQTDSNNYPYEIVYLGRLTYPKNPERSIDVFERVIDMRPQTRIAIIGTGELDETIRDLIQKKHLSENIDMLGFQSNPFKILYDSKVMIMTSRWEGTPMCALEALSLGVPIVSTAVDGLKDIVKNGESGYLLESNTEIAEHCVLLLQNKDLHDKLSATAEKNARDICDIENYRKSLYRIYQRFAKT